MIGEEQQFRYLNLANRWLNFDLHDTIVNPDGSLTLARVPGLSDIVGTVRATGIGPVEPAGVTSDAEGNIYVTDPLHHWVFKLDSCSGIVARLSCIGNPGSEAGQLNHPRGLLVGPRQALYVADSKNHRVQVVDLHTGQLRGIWGEPDAGTTRGPSSAIGEFNLPWALAADHEDAIYVVERAGRRIQKFDADGNLAPGFWKTLSDELIRTNISLVDPSYIASGPCDSQECLYLVDVKAHEVLVIDSSGCLLHRWELSHSIDPVGIVVVRSAVYIGDASKGELLQFDLRGQRIGVTPDYHARIAALGLWCDESLLWYPGGGEGVARLRPDSAFVPEGQFRSGPIDGCVQKQAWHRLQVLAEPLPNEAHLRLYTFTSDQCTPGPAGGSIPFSFSDGWQPADADALDMLVSSPPGRYLWIGGDLRGNGRVSPKLAQMQVTYPPDTYLRYLPAIYREDESKRRFLEQWLALFESVLGRLEGQIDDLPLLFDPLAVPSGWTPWLTGWQAPRDHSAGPSNWLPWLASWLALELDETWSEDQTRRIIIDSFKTHGMRGTVEGLRHLLKAYTGVESFIEEPGRFVSLWSLDHVSTLGFDTILAPAHEQGAVLDATATLDGSHLLATETPGAPLLEDVAFKFHLRVYRSDLKNPRTLSRIKTLLDREKPAHTEYELCVIEPRFLVGWQAAIGIDAIVGGPPQGFATDSDQALGIESILAAGPEDHGGTISIPARVGHDTTLS